MGRRYKEDSGERMDKKERQMTEQKGESCWGLCPRVDEDRLRMMMMMKSMASKRRCLDINFNFQLLG